MRERESFMSGAPEVVPESIPTPAHPKEEVPKSAQPESVVSDVCLSSPRLVQHEEKAQTVTGLETSAEESNARGKSDDSIVATKDCTVAVDLSSQLSTLRKSIPDTHQAIITFQRQSIHMFFSPENAIADFKRKVKELWNIPVKLYYLLVNGVHESLIHSWHAVTSVIVKIRGLGAGSMTKVHLKATQNQQVYEVRLERTPRWRS
jgi:hypothetical protein